MLCLKLRGIFAAVLLGYFNLFLVFRFYALFANFRREEKSFEMQQVFYLFIFASLMLRGSVSNLCYEKAERIQIKIKYTFKIKLKGSRI